eukprot:gnl/MRDRNA2_/MRDRNA2_70340_c0_seq2.p1 gnl/MRDRNA2_/MRDRNA2_70340_c0~~gnl/MRDRNA2_/MRDRNA2_70340_c0_seq2.p1  ORF type:complete len:673 (-),score=112.77 gnl/MRDRNA2_/MRDRNA2_70340_c0_seq2:177-2195(-)
MVSMKVQDEVATEELQNESHDHDQSSSGGSSPKHSQSRASVSSRRSSTATGVPDDAPEYQVYMWAKYPKLVQFVNSNKFESVMGVIIMYNCLTIGVGVHLCPPKDSVRNDEDCPTEFLDASEHICTLIFVIEWTIRGLCSGFPYHINSWDRVGDTGLVWITGVLLTWIVDPAMDGSGPSEMRMLTALRAFRLLRVARVIRFNFKELWLMLRGLAGSAKALSSMIAVFVFIFYLFGILAVTLIGDSPLVAQGDPEVHEFFNGLDKSMWTLLQMVTADSWSSGIARPVINVLPQMWLYFVSYIALAMMVLMNLVTAIIVENALNQSKSDEESLLRELEVKKESEFKHLHNMFTRLDRDGSGELDEEEFNTALEEEPMIVDQFMLLGFEENEIRNFFKDLDNGDGSLSTDEFIGGLQAMQGTARSADLIRTQKCVERVEKRLDKLFQHLGIQNKEDEHVESNEDDHAAPNEDQNSRSPGIYNNGTESSVHFQVNLPSRVTHSVKSTVDSTLSTLDTSKGISESAKEELAVAGEMRKSLESMLHQIHQELDQRASMATEELQRTLSEFLSDLRKSVAETCRQELSKDSKHGQFDVKTPAYSQRSSRKNCRESIPAEHTTTESFALNKQRPPSAPAALPRPPGSNPQVPGLPKTRQDNRSMSPDAHTRHKINRIFEE